MNQYLICTDDDHVGASDFFKSSMVMEEFVALDLREIKFEDSRTRRIVFADSFRHAAMVARQLYFIQEHEIKQITRIN